MTCKHETTKLTAYMLEREVSNSYPHELFPIQGKSLPLCLSFGHLMVQVDVVVLRDGNPAHLVLQLTSFLLRSLQQDHVGSGLVLVKNSIELLQSCIKPEAIKA